MIGFLRSVVRISIFLVMFVIAIVESWTIGKSVRARARWMQRWSKRVVRLCGIHITVVGQPPQSGLLVSNHISYTDVLVLGSILPSVFVSKDAVESWPMVGWLTKIAGTIFVNRESRMATAQVAEQMRDRMEQGVPVIFFPEGTSSDGSGLLPFKTSLFEAPVRAGATIHACCLKYSVPGADESVVRERVAYWGDMTFAGQLPKLISMKRVDVRVEFAPEQIDAKDRKQAAAESEAIIRGLMGLRSEQVQAAQLVQH